MRDRLRAELAAGRADPRAWKAAYLGASNGDEPAFYEIFAAAMEELTDHRAEHRFVHSPARDGELSFLEQADLILLAGGDPAAGWRALAASGAAAILAERYRQGAILVGISAGAVQLGQAWLGEGGELRPMSGLLPYLIDAHDEPDWSHLRNTLRRAPALLAGRGGLGVPFGGVAVVAPDGTAAPLEGLGKPLFTLAPPALPHPAPALVLA